MVKLSFNEKEIEGLGEGLAYVCASRGFELGEGGAAVTVEKTGSGLYIEGTDGRYRIGYCGKNEFFRAVSTLVGLLERAENSISVHETQRLKLCGAMIDCSRNAVPRVDTMIDIFAKLASAGMNAVMLYTEDTYEIEGYEYFGYMRGRYSGEELHTLDLAASALGLDMIPCIQTLAHLGTTLHWGYADGMRDTNEILLIGEEKTYEFIDAMFRSLRKSCSSKRIHIGMDEAHFVGRGEYLNRHGYCNRFDLLAEHLDRVCELARKYDFEPMMWSDMFFRLGSKTGAYYDLNVQIPKDLPDKIPENISLVYWDYYNSDENVYRTMIKNHRDMGCEIIFAGGVWKWTGMGADYRKTFETTIPALNVCRKEGVDSIFATMWGDDGAEVSVSTALLGIQLFAEYSYYEQVTSEHLKEKFALCMGLDMDSFLAFELDDVPEDATAHYPCAVSKQVLFQDVLCGLFDKNMEAFNLPEFYAKKLEKLNSIHDARYEYLFDYYRILVKVLSEKAHIGIELKAAYDRRDKPALEAVREKLETLAKDFALMQDRFAAVWEKENKVFGYDRYDLRCGGALARIKTAIRRIDDYCSGSIASIEELEEERLYFRDENTKNKLPAVQAYSMISSASAP